MADSTVFALRYANAFASVAKSEGLDVAAAQGQMRSFSALLTESRELREILADPSVPSTQKLDVIDALAERLGLMRPVRNFIAVMMDHQRLGELDLILAEYDKVADTAGGITEAEVTSAHELNGDDRQALEVKVAKLAGSRVRIAYNQDASLLGGAVVKIGSTVYDGSVRTQLEQMKQSLSAA